MGKSDENQTKKRAWKATCESKHKKKPSFDATDLKLLMMREFATLNGATSSDNCVNTRQSSATAACHNGMPPTTRSGGGFRLSALDTERLQKESQLS
jgi:hypothetical protein